MLGAVLLTGYLGGAVAIHLRAGSTVFEQVFPVILGVIAWPEFICGSVDCEEYFP